MKREEKQMTDVTDTVRTLWATKSETYDNSAWHHPRSAVEWAAWSGAMRRLLPPPPARVLDVGTGTGFLAVLLAKQGYEVTALDLSPQMLARLEDKATEVGLKIKTVVGDAAAPPKEDFDGVVERHVLWTLPDPVQALKEWREAAPTGRLVLFASEWGSAFGNVARARSLAHDVLRRFRGECPGDNTRYRADLKSKLPLVHGTTPEQLLTMVEGSDWGAPRIERLPDLDWAARRAMPSMIDRLIGPLHNFAVTAG